MRDARGARYRRAHTSIRAANASIDCASLSLPFKGRVGMVFMTYGACGAATKPIPRPTFRSNAQLLRTLLESALPRIHRGLGAVAHIELAEHIADVRLHGFLADAEAFGDLQVAEAIGHQGQHFAFALAQ